MFLGFHVFLWGVVVWWVFFFFFGGGLFHLLLTDYKTLFLIYQLLGHLDEDILFYFLIYINVNILKIGK